MKLASELASAKQIAFHNVGALSNPLRVGMGHKVEEGGSRLLSPAPPN